MWEHVRDERISVHLAKKSSKMTDDDDDASSDGHEHVDDSALVELWDARDAAGAVGFGGDPFYLIVRGGRWTLENRGVAYDSFRGVARSGAPVEFCTAARLNRSITCTASSYGDEVAVVLVEFWCARMRFFFEHWLSSEAGELDW